MNIKIVHWSRWHRMSERRGEIKKIEKVENIIFFFVVVINWYSYGKWRGNYFWLIITHHVSITYRINWSLKMSCFWDCM